jgi:hypothetical protein
MFKTISAGIPRDQDYPERTWDIDVRARVLNGSFYDHLQFCFQDETREDGTYIPLRERRPSVIYKLAAIIVDDSVGMLFSDGHFPQVRCEDEATRTGFATLIRECRLNSVMIEAASTGSTGSVAILMRILSNRAFFDVFDTRFLTPVWNPKEPDTLLRIEERYKVSSASLAVQGYAVASDKAEYWFGRDWDSQSETWYLPWTAEDAAKPGFMPAADDARTVKHALGFVPWVWIRNLPGGDGIDGSCTFAAAITESIEIDYQLSQLGRGLRYSSDPTLLIKEPAMGQGAMVKGAADAIVVDRDGDAKLLEISGTAAAAVLDYARHLRELALEATHGNRSNADKIAAVQSGRAMELMHHALILLADKLRISYGQDGLLELLCLVQRAVRQGKKLQTKKGKPLEIDADADLQLGWPAWFAPTSHDLLELGQGYQVLRGAGLLSQETGVGLVAKDYDLPDATAELKRIKAEPPPAVTPAASPQDAQITSEEAADAAAATKAADQPVAKTAA